MKLMTTLLLSALMLITTSAAASAYENLAYALRQQKIINDLRDRCQIGKDVTDEKIKDVFLHNAATQNEVIAAATALSKQDDTAYAASIKAVQCPEMH